MCIRDSAYAYLFYFVEAYIVTATMEHARAELYGDEIVLRTLLRFTEEEVKHQQMFLRFGELFDRDFGTEVGLTDSPQEVAGYILSKSPMAVLLVTLHLEISPRADRSEIERRTLASESPVAAAISESKR